MSSTTQRQGQPLPETAAVQILEDDRRYLLHSWSAQKSRRPLLIAGGSGAIFWDARGKRYLDFASQLVNLNLGFGHPRVVSAIQAQAAELCYVAPEFASAPRSELARAVAAVAPGDLNRVFFTTGGATANEAAIRMARLATGRQKVITRRRSYHGATAGALSLSGDPRRRGAEPGVWGTVVVEDPFCYRCPFGLRYPSCGIHCADHIGEVIEFEDPDTVAAVIVETITGSNARIVPPPEYYPRLREICDRYGVLLICDEVMAGFGRTGRWFAIEHYDVVPDLMTLGKGITSGYVPLGAVVVSDRVAVYFESNVLPTGATYSGHPLACAAGVATLAAYHDEGLIERARLLGDRLFARLNAMKERHPAVGDVRGRGLFACIELVCDRETREPLTPWTPRGSRETHPAVSGTICAMRERGVYAYTKWNMLMLAPPLVITDEQLEEGLQVIDEALAIADRHVTSA
ncbi:MAG TPA: aminotransferase class III-fold pyridoxal phosphate-dependent enzyme [bacterium]|nr:aminotransferase class III-fold pyridoxal phosphate-dependent enzyme [bacterium]